MTILTQDALELIEQSEDEQRMQYEQEMENLTAYAIQELQELNT